MVHIWSIYGPYMTIYEPHMDHVWTYMAHIWPYMDHIWSIYGHIWTISGPYIVHMAIYGYTYGHIWSYMDHIWTRNAHIWSTYGPYMAQLSMRRKISQDWIPRRSFEVSDSPASRARPRFYTVSAMALPWPRSTTMGYGLGLSHGSGLYIRLPVCL